MTMNGLAVGCADFVDGADVRMIQLRGMLGFAPQSRVRVGVVAERDFDGNSPAQLEIAGKVDLAHSTGADEALDLVMSNDSTSHRDRRLLDEPAVRACASRRRCTSARTASSSPHEAFRKAARFAGSRASAPWNNSFTRGQMSMSCSARP